MLYIGMDAHSSNCVFSVVDGNGEERDRAVVATNGRLIIDYLRSIEGRKKLTFEECELSRWLYGILQNEVDELVVCNPVANGECRGAKTDKLDARRLANLLRGNYVKGVYHDGSAREQFRNLVSGYCDVVESGVRLKNQYKSLFRKEGNRQKGTALYNDDNFLKGLKRSDFKFVGVQIFDQLQTLEVIRQKYVSEIGRVSGKFREMKYLKTIPGIGEIQAAKIISQVIEPGRFPTKYRFFSYCGLVRHQCESGGRFYGSKRIYGNRILKCVYKMAGHSALKGESGLRRYYDRLVAKGVSEAGAGNAVCRKIAAISLSVWRNERRYDDELVDKSLK
jgi:transposase